MEERVAHTQPTCASLFLGRTALVVFARAEPPSPPLGREGSVVVEAVAQLVVLTPAKDTVSGLRGSVEGSLENLEGPVVVKVHGVCSIDSLESVVEGNGRRPHFGEHVVLHQVCFAVHEVQEALRQTRDGDDGAASRRFWKLEIVAGNVVAEHPVGLGRVEDGVESDDVGFFTNTPLVVVLGIGVGRLNLWRAGKHTSVGELGRTPNWLLVAVVELLFDHLGEVLP